LGSNRLRDLIWKEEDFIAEIAPKLKKVMRIDTKGNPYFLVPYAKLGDSQRIGLHLVARYLAKQLKSVDSEYLTIEELAHRVGTKYSVAGARLKDMFDAGTVTKSKEKGKGTRYAILPHGISTIVEGVLKTKSGSKEDAEHDQENR